VQRLVCLIRSHLFIFVFILIALGDWPNKTSVQFMSEKVVPMFSSRSFMVWCLIFKSLTHFEFIFVHAMRGCSNVIDLHAAVQFSQHHLLKRLSFSHFIFFFYLFFFFKWLHPAFWSFIFEVWVGQRPWWLHTHLDPRDTVFHQPYPTAPLGSETLSVTPTLSLIR